VLNTINYRFKELEHYRAESVAKKQIDCIDFPINFTNYGNGHFFIKEGWGHPEPWGIWTVGEKSTMELYFNEVPRGNLLLNVHARPFIVRHDRRLQMRVHVDDEPLATWNLTRPRFEQFSMKIPAGKIRARECKIRFDINAPVSPREINAQSSDTRRLGAGLLSLHLRRAGRFA
jgi:hypothetical protein